MPFYEESFLEQVREQNDIVDVIGSYVGLKKKGADYECCCPFHQEKTPSFKVSPSRGIYKCFGCQTAGNVITFVQRYENVGFVEAVQILAGRAGIALPEVKYSAADSEKEKKRERFFQIYSDATVYFYKYLRCPEGQNGMDYCKERELTPEMMKKFGLGFAPINGHHVINYLKSKGYTGKELVECGLASSRDNGDLSCKFWNRLIFPIQNSRDKVIGFGGRIIGDGEPKYLNSQESLIFLKSNNLYAFNYARKSRSGYFILCEGYMDVISLHKAGFDSAVASLGTAFTQGQARILEKAGHNLYLCFDSDSAGVKAVRAAERICRNMKLKTKAINLKPYKDPDEFIKNLGGEEFQKRIDEAENAFLYVVADLYNNTDMEDPDESSYFKNFIIEELVDFDDEMTRLSYMESISKRFKIPMDYLDSSVKRLAMAKADLKPVFVPEKLDRNRDENKGKKSEQLLISYMINDRRVYNAIKDYVSKDDFTVGPYKEIYDRLFADLEEGHVEESKYISLFEDVDEQNDIGQLFTSSLDDVETRDDLSKAVKDILISVKSNAYDDFCKNAGNDDDMIMETIKRKKDLESIKKVQINL
ncbi:MAG: DNA primase [Lachnospiraceae bacterium]|nr:DNA primase [Lachnospiraceae bacterium]